MSICAKILAGSLGFAAIAVGYFSSPSVSRQALIVSGASLIAYGGESFVTRCVSSYKKYLVDVADSQGRTPLMRFAKKGVAEVMGVIVSAGVDVNAVDNNGVSALMLAASQGYAEVVKKLVAAGANVNAVDNNGMSALKLAASLWGHPQTVKKLLLNGAFIDSGFGSETKKGVLRALRGIAREEKGCKVCFIDEEEDSIRNRSELPPFMICWKEGDQISSISVDEAIRRLNLKY